MGNHVPLATAAALPAAQPQDQQLLKTASDVLLQAAQLQVRGEPPGSHALAHWGRPARGAPQPNCPAPRPPRSTPRWRSWRRRMRGAPTAWTRRPPPRARAARTRASWTRRLAA